MELFNIWDLENVHIRVNEKFIDKLNEKIISKFQIKRECHRTISKNLLVPYEVFKNMLKKSYYKNFFVPLNFLIVVCESVNISRDELQENIISYKSQGSINYIENPILPIEINPIFDMIYAHNIGDGTVSVAKNRSPYFAYRQFDLFYREAFIKKIESVFGKILHRRKEFKDNTRVRCPAVLSSLFFKYYNLNDRGFLSCTARLSEKIFKKGKDNMLAVLCGFIIDEGNVDSTQITIALKNKPLVEDLRSICDILGYKSKTTYRTGDYAEYGYLNILREGMKRLYEDYILLNEKYPVIDLGFKGEKIKKSFDIDSRKIIRTKGNYNMILNMLKQESLTVNQLANRINMTRQGVRFHIHNLLNQDKIRILDKSNPNWIYGV